ncbi:TIGR03013 family PEP-CTERM/XrtA system glycosyltransferase [Glaciimonas sp. Gout2]|uniref:TIGR03013 family XrtA/PEP-CTERM system glycosyltransferase n=1 Tax=unclassified Glaciimonas TaxID=2644401 RepID=UPI002AB42DDC|nr:MULTISPECIES: TIGR03013 family XrtA/PEP-CTERM system glycosyltransferase [unclassified Glaciimonas]MDY7544703.1 TIGR03013 family PEP-CTERM/XrtA system glycosyltransferase [Glaciimonas sp. CA11.2]MEB0011999.1 TIGR03013 family PEP-CTERM/XrtA system glycosyltransferase [Glaciimonas sp. Cout2]MEB0084548.1 TIGR03013 family PEP-CTERM/XrtA system glycosyltransferase [Glaciimonas sp. Gout2]
MLKISNHYVSKIVSILLGVEILILLSAAYLGVNIRFVGGSHWATNFAEFLPSNCAFVVSIVFGMSALGMYQRNLNGGLRTTFLRIMPSFAMGLGILIVVFYVAPELYLGRGILLLAFFFAGVGILLARAIFFKFSKSEFLASRIIFLGIGELARECSVVASGISDNKYHIVGYVSVGSETNCVPQGNIFCADESLLTIARRHDVNEIVVALQNRRGASGRINELLECKLSGIRVIESAAFFEREVCQIRVDSLLPSWLVFGTGFDQTTLRVFFKRFFDILTSVILLIFTAPIMLLAALCIFIEDRAPIFYQQERVGKDGDCFMVIKFRSMRNDAEQSGKPQWASSNDPRITRVGSIIRKLRIDELPQILNVLKGEMSFVGPRPERPYFVRQLSKEILFYNVRHSVKPGITGWAQVRYQYGSSVEDAIQKLQYDLYYVKNNSLFLDILILIDTLRVVLFGAGR